MEHVSLAANSPAIFMRRSQTAVDVTRVESNHVSRSFFRICK